MLQALSAVLKILVYSCASRILCVLSEKIEHVKAGEDGGASKKGKMAEGKERPGMSTSRPPLTAKLPQECGCYNFLTCDQTKGMGCRLVPARKSEGKGAKAGEMRRDEGAGEPLRSGFTWCFGVYTYTSKEVT